MSIADDFEHRRSLLNNLARNEAGHRLTGMYEWLISEDTTKDIIKSLEEDTNAEKLLEDASRGNPPKAATPEDIAGVGFLLFKRIQGGADIWDLSYEYGIEPQYSTSSAQDHVDYVVERFIDPALDYIAHKLQTLEGEATDNLLAASQDVRVTSYPVEIYQSLGRFLTDHPDVRRNAFIMMQFGSTKSHSSIVKAIRDTLLSYGITAHRADDKEYHDDLFGNVLTYLHGCSFGIAVFERLETDDFNPNVSLEVGYMRAQGKSICLLKDMTLKTMQTDLIGKLYKAFDPQDPVSSIPEELEKWLRDKDIVQI